MNSQFSNDLEKNISQLIYDDIFIGAGLSTLSLLQALLEKGYRGKILILEQGSDYQKNKTWCFWEKEKSLWYEKSECQWNSWLFKKENSYLAHLHQSKTWAYCYLPAEKFFQEIDRKICQEPQVTILFNENVLSVTSELRSCAEKKEESKLLSPDKIFILKTCQKNFQGRRIFDSRIQSHQALLYQQFYGQELELSEAMDRKDVGLMENISTDRFGLRFIYFLPLSSHRVLVEWTRFTSVVHEKTKIIDEFKRELEKLPLKIKSLIREEEGILPMGLIDKNSMISQENQHYKIGTSSGALRQATGYGFLRLQSWAEKAAQELLSEGKLSKQLSYESRFQIFMDRVFLLVLKNHPSRSAEFIVSLVENTDPDVFVRFMSDKASKLDYFKIMRALPPWPFLKQAFQEIFVNKHFVNKHRVKTLK